VRKLKVTELRRLTSEEYKTSEKTPLVVVFDHIRSLNNVGSVFRTADAFRLEAVYLCGITATPPNAEIHKTALGAEETVEWHYYKDTLECARTLKNKGYYLCAIEQAEGSFPLDEIDLGHGNKFAIVLGHEVKGVQQEVINECHCCIEIPQFGTKHSLNVSVAAGIVIWEFFKYFGK
jgi:tRNA G18 (ribose-2'-O)-methylase SpoU